MHDRLKPLVSLHFIVCLVLLIVNDFFLKAAFHNTFTGKLSDFCGLFIFPIFWSVLFPKHKLGVFILTGILFIYWKSEYASLLIEFVGTYMFSVQRTVDPTDFVALPVLWLAWLSVNKSRTTIPAKPFIRYLSPYFIAGITIFSFCATSQPKYVQSFEQPQYVLFTSDVMPDSNSYRKDFELYTFDSLLVVKVNQMFTTHRAVKYDDYEKNQVVKNLDKEILSMMPGIKSLMPPGKITSLTIRNPQGEDFMRFNGGRLDGRLVRKKAGKITIEGFYKMGIEDSIWTFRDTSNTVVTKVTFHNGERTKVQRFDGSNLISFNGVNTRADTKRNKCIQIGVLVAVMMVTIVFLVKSYRGARHQTLQIKSVWKWLLCLVLPMFVWLFQLGITQLLGNYNQDIFETLATIFLIYILTCPLFFIIIFWIKLNSQIDIFWYCLLLAVAFSIWEQYNVLLELSV
jgi:hypothetical protein